MESLVDAKEELKRVDHQIFVSLKHTRTCDVLMNIINRMVDAYECMIRALLRYAIECKLLDQEPVGKLERAEKVKALFPEEVVKDNIGLYFLLRKIRKDENPKREREYRRHVTMTCIVDQHEEIINIDIITNYYYLQRKLFDFVEKLVLEKWNEGKKIDE
ncbi:hypothetical protein D6783_04700 [Candidatus Woesearchaeota archaeon]|nr:MAG: hypothetical protein D6783_04700 [Candidatus Woesearchaeota archaeon]